MGRFQEFNHYIFDFDMTLFDTSSGMAPCYRAAFDAVGCDHDFRESDVRDYLRGELAETYSQLHANGTLRQFQDAFRSTEPDVSRMEPFPETKRTLVRLHDLCKPVSVVAGEPASLVHRVLKENGMDWLVGTVVGQGDYGKPKPSSEPLDACVSKVGVPKAECVYIGDSKDDMESARSAWMTGILIDRTGETYGSIQFLDDILP